MKKDLIVRYLIGEADEQERVLVEEWAKKSLQNQEELELMKTVWGEHETNAQMMEVDIDQAWSNFKQLRDASKTVKSLPTMQQKKSRYVWLRVAAAILAFCALAFWTLQSQLSVEKSLATVFETQKAGLPDGSTVYMNKNAEMVYRKQWYDKDRKVALLKGEIFFDVKRDEQHPFVIESGKSKIKVLGTSFHVRRDGMNTEVIVASGSVQVSYGSQHVVLQPNQMVVVSDTLKTALRLDTVPDKLYRYYVHQEFMFENTPLKRVFEILGKAYNKQFIIEDSKTKELPYTATFKAQSLNEMIEVILKTFDLKISQKNNIYYIK